jgi:fumarate reductase subunit C
MSADAEYTPYHPRWLRARVSTYWWLRRGSYLAFILRELSSLFVAWSVVCLLFLVRAVSNGEAAYRAFLQWAAHPIVLALNIITLLFLVFHAITWFNLAPQAMVVKLGKFRVPGVLIAGSNYAAWVVLSAGLAWLFLSGG